MQQSSLPHSKSHRRTFSIRLNSTEIASNRSDHCSFIRSFAMCAWVAPICWTCWQMALQWHRPCEITSKWWIRSDWSMWKIIRNYGHAVHRAGLFPCVGMCARIDHVALLIGYYECCIFIVQSRNSIEFETLSIRALCSTALLFSISENPWWCSTSSVSPIIINDLTSSASLSHSLSLSLPFYIYLPFSLPFFLPFSLPFFLLFSLKPDFDPKTAAFGRDAFGLCQTNTSLLNK